MAKKRIQFAIRVILFTALALYAVHAVNEWMKPKYGYAETWPTTNTYEDFYQLKRDTVDVLLLGSSHAVSSLNPQVIYDEYGITSYNLGSEAQSPVITYYWLREALKYQSPKVVVLDTYMLYKYMGYFVYNEMNCDEESARKAMDEMRLSPLKWEASRAIEKLNPAWDRLSFLLLNVRHHARWTLLGEDDYAESEMIEHGGVKGYSTLGGNDPGLNYTPFRASDADTVQAEEMVGCGKVYLDKIVDLCNSKNIQLMLVNIPCGAPIERYKSANEYAKSKNLAYLDFNEESLYNEIGYDSAENLLSHPNYLGAEKISGYIGKILKDEYGIAPRTDSSYEASRELYEHKIRNLNLQETTDIYQYLDQINRDEYSIFLFAPKSYGAFISPEIMGKLFAMGFTTDLCGIGEDNCYYAVKDAGKVTEWLTKEDVNISGSIRGGLTTYGFKTDTSMPAPAYHVYSLQIDGSECANQDPEENDGLLFVIYDNELKRVVDKVNFNTALEEIPVSRNQ